MNHDNNSRNNSLQQYDTARRYAELLSAVWVLTNDLFYRSIDKIISYRCFNNTYELGRPVACKQQNLVVEESIFIWNQNAFKFKITVKVPILNAF